MRELKDVLTSGPTIGGWCGIPSGFAAELMGTCGWDWVCVDIQHGLIAYEQASQMLQSLAVTGTPSLVRVPWNSPDHIMKALDAGAQGVIVPMVNSADEARLAVSWAKYPPIGMRSFGPVRAELYVASYSPGGANEKTVVSAMIETVDGYNNRDEIMAVPSLDAIYIGPSDLALSHGLAPTMRPASGSEHEKLILNILESCGRHNVIAGIHCNDAETATRWRDAGFQMIAIASDGALMRSAARAVIEAVGGHVVPAPSGSTSYAAVR